MYDLAIIGAGPGGYVAAIRASQLKLKVALIDKEQTLGGTCLNVGCIPSKALLEATDIYAKMVREGSSLGFSIKESFVHFEQLMQKKSSVVEGLTKGVAHLMKKNGVDVFTGKATLQSGTTLLVDGDTVEAQSILIATGAEAIQLSPLQFDGERILSSTEVLSLSEQPKSLLIIGAGVIGVELASVYARIGTKVQLVEALDRVMPSMDRQVSKELQRILTKQGLEFFLEQKVTGSEVTQDGVKVFLEEKELFAEKVLVAVGRRPYTQGLGLEKLEIEIDDGGRIVVDENFRTSVPSIFAIGDVIKGPMLAHRASEEGIAVAEYLAGEHPELNYMTIPNVIYTNPEVATVGWTESEAKEHHVEPITGTFSLRGNPRARASFTSDGFVKVVADKESRRIVGVHILAPHASEWIGMGVLAIASKLTLDQLANVPYAHPTLSEALKEAALNALDRTLHA